MGDCCECGNWVGPPQWNNSYCQRCDEQVHWQSDCGIKCDQCKQRLCNSCAGGNYPSPHSEYGYICVECVQDNEVDANQEDNWD